jgi:hypothetical protein
LLQTTTLNPTFYIVFSFFVSTHRIIIMEAAMFNKDYFEAAAASLTYDPILGLDYTTPHSPFVGLGRKFT